MAKRHFGQAPYDSVDHRRDMERADGGMLNEDHSAMANLPQGVVMRYYPRVDGFMREKLDDTITGIDRQMGSDNSKARLNERPEKV